MSRPAGTDKKRVWSIVTILRPYGTYLWKSEASVGKIYSCNLFVLVSINHLTNIFIHLIWRKNETINIFITSHRDWCNLGNRNRERIVRKRRHEIADRSAQWQRRLWTRNQLPVWLYSMRNGINSCALFQKKCYTNWKAWRFQLVLRHEMCRASVDTLKTSHETFNFTFKSHRSGHFRCSVYRFL